MTFRRLVVAVQLFAFLGGAGEAWLLRCSGDRQVHTRCCCPDVKTAPIPTVIEGCCCSLERGAPAREASLRPVGVETPDAVAAAPSLAFVLTTAPPASRPAAPLYVRSLGPPGTPTLFAQRTALLV